MKFNYSKNEVKIAKAAIIIIFLALIRCISESFRLQYYSEIELTFSQLKPFLIASLITAIALLMMIISLFYQNNKLIIGLAIITVSLLLIIKWKYSIH